MKRVHGPTGRRTLRRSVRGPISTAQANVKTEIKTEISPDIILDLEPSVKVTSKRNGRAKTKDTETTIGGAKKSKNEKPEDSSSTRESKPSITELGVPRAANGDAADGDSAALGSATVAIKTKEPPHWRDIVAKVQEMRSSRVAPVDTMGCHELKDKTLDPKTSRYHLLVSLMLSSQTKDEVTAAAHERLRASLPGGLTVDSVLNSTAEQIDKLIYPVGFHTRKSQYIMKATKILHEMYNDDIPPTIKEMMALPGVGPKMSYLLMSAAWSRHEGIGVDTHVYRFSRLWKWVPKSCDTPEKVRAALESWLPHEWWHDINPLLVGFGQTVCLPQRPRCSECTLTRKECPGRREPVDW